MKIKMSVLCVVAACAAAYGGSPIYLTATDFVRATGNPSLVTWAKGSVHVPVWSFSGGTAGQSIAALTPPLPVDCTAVRVAIQVVNGDPTTTNSFTDVYRVHIAQVADGHPLNLDAEVGKPVGSAGNAERFRPGSERHGRQLRQLPAGGYGPVPA